MSPTSPRSRELLVRNGYVLTMDARLGDVDGGDVLIRDGAIAAVGRSLPASADAELIDATDKLVLPGLIETHWHVWSTLLRSMSGDRDAHGYFPMSRTLGAHYTPEDMYRSARLASAEALHSGITFLHDWCHNVRGPSYAEAELRALTESGIRARFSYGSPTGAPVSVPIDRADLARLARAWRDFDNGGLLTLGLAWRGAGSEASLGDYRAARELGLPISVHANNFQSSAGGIAALAQRGLLVPGMQIIHAIWCSREEIAALAAQRAVVSLSPFTELRIGFGLPLTKQFLDAGITVGLSVDTPALSGNADMFGIMKAIQNIENARSLDEFALPARRVLELATIEGARSMGVDDRIGSLVPGKRADLILVDRRHLNLAVLGDPAHLLVEAAQPANVDTVIVDGRVRKRGGVLAGADIGRIVDEARESLAAVRKRASWD